MESETVPTLDEIRRRKEREQSHTAPLEVVHKDLDGMHAQLDMMRDGLWRNLDVVEAMRRKLDALATTAAVMDVKLDAIAEREKPERPDIPTRLLTGVLVACVVLLTLRQVGWL